MEQFLVVGITGPSGAGKTLVADYLLHLGYSVINADNIARIAVEKGQPALQAIVAQFGNIVLNINGELERAKLADIVFSSRDQLEQLNKIIFPYILDCIKQNIAILSQPGTFIFLDAPTLFESGADKLCTQVITVLSDKFLRQQRIIRRDNLLELQANLRITAQPDNSYYTTRSQYVILNNGSLTELYQQVDAIITDLKEKL